MNLKNLLAPVLALAVLSAGAAMAETPAAGAPMSGTAPMAAPALAPAATPMVKPRAHAPAHRRGLGRLHARGRRIGVRHRLAGKKALGKGLKPRARRLAKPLAQPQPLAPKH